MNQNEDENLSLKEYVLKRLEILDKEQNFESISDADSKLYKKWNSGFISENEYRMLKNALAKYYENKTRL